MRIKPIYYFLNNLSVLGKYFFIFVLCSFFSSDFRFVSPLNNYKPIENFFLIRQFFNDEFTSKKYFESLNLLSDRTNLRSVPKGFNENWILRGPSKIGARVNVIKQDPFNHQIVLLGFSSGGLWKTNDGGKSWKSMFDEFPWLAIADINIDPFNSNIIYVATGDPNISGYPFVGDGIYKSIDGGLNWKNIGPSGVQIISKILISPENSKILYASSMGLPFQKDKLRGIYRSLDGGNTWEKRLHVADETGIIDLIFDPFNPNNLYATSWPRVRNNRESILTGTTANIWKSTDAGATWKISATGINPGPKGRMGLVASKKTPNLIFAIVMGENNEWEGFYKSINGGLTWTNLFKEPSASTIPENAMGGFGWYFGKIEINPYNDQDLFILGVDLWRSKDGGITWNLGAPPWYEQNIHADKHDLVFLNENEYLLASDGGVYISKDKGNTWADYEQIPATQFYRIAFNPHKPTFYYGGAQDHGTLEGNSPDNWQRLYGGDGFQQVFDSGNPAIIYTLTQNGNILASTNKGLSFSTIMNGIDKFEPVAWDAPLIKSPFNTNVLYTGTSRIYKNTNGPNASWKAISNDLTDGNIYGARFHNITTIHESHVLQGLLYAGTSDANCWRFDPETSLWTQINNGLPERYVTSIQASPTFPDHVYVTQSGYKDYDWQSHLFLSKERGEKWRPVRGDLPYISINDLVIIPGRNDSLLFVATDAGVYGSVNAGGNWHKLGANLPLVAVYDLEYVPEKMELIAGTFGRSIHTYNLKSILEKELTLSVNPVSLQFPAIGGNVSLNISSNTNWELNKREPFLNLSSFAGSNNGMVKVTCEPNPTFDQRSGTILVNGTGVDSILIKVTQEKTIPFFSTFPQSLHFIETGGNQSLSISTNTTWNLFESLDFITTSISQVNGNSTIEVKSTMNSTSLKREGFLRFLPNGLDTLFVKITQAGSLASGSVNKSMSQGLFKVYPNPVTSEFITLQRLNQLNNPEGINALLYNQNGHLLKSYPIPVYENSTNLNLPNILKGAYYLVFRNKNHKILQTVKLIK
ncbi:MAG: hypothetical protein RLZZ417_2220 [Bacteroidota bacterium]|jgi:photosystem II stability/assembly factor-like uncharacterized protein